MLVLYFHNNFISALEKWSTCKMVPLTRKRKKIAVENTLKAVYQELEVQSFSKDLILISDLAKEDG